MCHLPGRCMCGTSVGSDAGATALVVSVLREFFLQSPDYDPDAVSVAAAMANVPDGGGGEPDGVVEGGEVEVEVEELQGVDVSLAVRGPLDQDAPLRTVLRLLDSAVRTPCRGWCRFHSELCSFAGLRSRALLCRSVGPLSPSRTLRAVLVPSSRSLVCYLCLFKLLQLFGGPDVWVGPGGAR